MSNHLLAKAIYQAALQCGYDDCGIIPVSDLDSYAQRLEERQEAVPQSREFYEQLHHFTCIKEDYPWAKSIIICSIWMGKYQYPQSLQGKYAKAFMLSADAVPGSSRFQKKRDFEVWLSKQNLQFLGGETNAPARLFPLRHAAVAAGMGIFRKNNFFYGPKGSYYELDGYLISEDCLYKHSCTIPPCSDTCTICQRACRTKALSAPYTMDPLSCISFWTTFGQGNIPPHLKEEQFSTWICGCDACQDACPYNRHDWSQGEEYPEVAEIESLLQPENILQASDAVLREKVIPKTEYHILPDQVQTLKISAARALKYIHAASDNG